MPLNRVRQRLALAYAFAFVALATSPAYAAGSNMPWEQPLNQILESVQGPIAQAASPAWSRPASRPRSVPSAGRRPAYAKASRPVAGP